MKIGVSLKIDVTKIEKARLFEGKQGKYLDAIAFIDIDAKDQYGNNGMITQSVSKDEKAAGVKGPILGNARVFFTDKDLDDISFELGKAAPLQNQAKPKSQPSNDYSAGFGGGEMDDDIPFMRLLSSYAIG